MSEGSGASRRLMLAAVWSSTGIAAKVSLHTICPSAGNGAPPRCGRRCVATSDA